MGWGVGGGERKQGLKNESWLILSELEASAPESEDGGLSLPVPQSAVKCPVEETVSVISAHMFASRARALFSFK